MSKPKDPSYSGKPFYKGADFSIYTVKEKSKVSYFEVRHGKTIKKFHVINHKILKAWQEMENYINTKLL